MGVSLKPSEASSGGAVIDDVDVRIVGCRFNLWDYNGTIQAPVLALKVTFLDDEGNQSEQQFSAGDTKHFVPNEDGTEAVQVGSIPTLNDNTNAMAFMASLVNSGFPEDKILDKVSVFEGTKVHVKQAPQPKRAGIKNAQPNQGAKTVLLVNKIHELPWEPAAQAAMQAIGAGAQAAAAGKPKVAGAPKAAAPKQAAPAMAAQAPAVLAAAVAQAHAPGGNGEALDGEARQAVLEMLLAKGGTMAKAALAADAFKFLSTHPKRNEMVTLIYKDEFLKGGPWSFDGSTLSMG